MIAIGGPVESITLHCSPAGYGAAILAFKSRVMGTFHMTSRPLPVENYALYGDTWRCDITNNTRLALHRSYGPTDTDTFLPPGNDTGALVWEAQNVRATIENNSLFTQGIYAEMRYFCDCILEQRAAERGSLEFGLEVMKVYEAGLLSNGETVSIR